MTLMVSLSPSTVVDRDITTEGTNREGVEEDAPKEEVVSSTSDSEAMAVARSPRGKNIDDIDFAV